MCVFVCELLFTVHAFLSEAFCEGISVDLQLRDLKTTTKKNLAVGPPSLLLVFFLSIHIYVCVYYFGTLLFW